MIKFDEKNEVRQELAKAISGGDEEQIANAWESFENSIMDKMSRDFEDFKESNDCAILAQRGYRQLTAAENKFYDGLISALKSGTPQQSFASIIGTVDDMMPETIIEDVFKNLRDEYPLLNAVNFQYVKYMTKWILNDHTKQKAAWGAINSAIAQQITSSFKVIDVNQNKLSAYAFIEKDMLDLGPTFLDAYIRACLSEALSYGLEDGIVNGTGVNQPVGLIRDLSSYNVSTGYAAKSATAVTDFTPASYGALLATMAETEDGATRKFTKVGLAVNMADYLTKIMPATTLLNNAGQYVSDLFPFPTEVYVCNSVADDHAILFLPEEYYLMVGGEKNGVIEFSDDFKFLDDARYFKTKLYGAGRCFDNTCAVYLDISGIDPAYITVRNEASGAVTVSGDINTTDVTPTV